MNNTEIITLVQTSVKSVRTRNNNAKKVVVECNDKTVGKELYQCISKNPGYFFQKGSYKDFHKGADYRDFTYIFDDTTQAAYFKEKIEWCKRQTVDYDAPATEEPATADVSTSGGVSGTTLLIIAAVVVIIALVLWKKRR